MRRLIQAVWGACMLLTSSCASRPQLSQAVPRIAMPAEATQPCSLFVLPASPSMSDLEIGYVTRGSQIATCDAARDLAVQTHAAEHALQDQIMGKSAKPAH
jgi:uncharacterized lipoprotein YajG